MQNLRNWSICPKICFGQNKKFRRTFGGNGPRALQDPPVVEIIGSCLGLYIAQQCKLNVSWNIRLYGNRSFVLIDYPGSTVSFWLWLKQIHCHSFAKSFAASESVKTVKSHEHVRLIGLRVDYCRPQQVLFIVTQQRHTSVTHSRSTNSRQQKPI